MQTPQTLEVSLDCRIFSLFNLEELFLRMSMVFSTASVTYPFIRIDICICIQLQNMVVSFTSRIQRLVTQKIVLNPCMDGACQPIDVCWLDCMHAQKMQSGSSWAGGEWWAQAETKAKQRKWQPSLSKNIQCLIVFAAAKPLTTYFNYLGFCKETRFWRSWLCQTACLWIKRYLPSL